ncbi:MAG: hypothetical protein K2X03_30235 [Bryobacteraceae bacterium]|nr:hypothetical protein [Bryobacteraceae bacterium]
MRLLPQVRRDRAVYQDYCRWVTLTRTEMRRMFEAHRASCQARRQWDLAGLLRLRCLVELVAFRLYCAPWLKGSLTAVQEFGRLTRLNA